MEEDIRAYMTRVGNLVRRIFTPVWTHPLTEKVPIGIRRIVLELAEHPEGVPSGKLAEHVGVGTGRIANALKILEEKGLVSRYRGEEDSRNSIVVLTDKGRERVDNLRKEFASLFTYVVTRIGKERMDSLLDTSEEIFALEDEYFREKEGATC